MWHMHIQDQQLHINKHISSALYKLQTFKKRLLLLRKYTHTYIKFQTQEISWRFHHELFCASAALYLVPESHLMVICYLIPK